jgi:hypothetical protein
MMTELRFTHLTTGKPVSVTKELAYGVLPADSVGGTYILAVGGAIMPVAETPDQVRSLIYGTSKTSQDGKTKPNRRG